MSTLQQQQQNSTGTGSIKQDVLEAILESPNFTISEYLNTALSFDYGTSSGNDNKDGTSTGTAPAVSSSLSSSSSLSQQMIHQLTEIALLLQIQTQQYHNDIDHSTMELQTILSRYCINDLQRIQSYYYDSLYKDALQLYNDCSFIMNSSTTGAGTSTSTITVTETETETETGSTVDPTSNSNTAVVTAAAGGVPVPVALSDPNLTVNSSNESGTSNTCMETLYTLHSIQKYLLRTKEIIIAYHIWDTTIHAITNHIQQSNTHDAIQCLLVLQQSESTLRSMKYSSTENNTVATGTGSAPSEDDRKNLLDKLQQQIVTILLQPTLQQALSILPQYNHTSITNNTTNTNTSTTTGSTTPSTSTTNMNNSIVTPIQQCVQYYIQLQQLDVLIMEYVKSRCNAIHKLWFTYDSTKTINEQGQIIKSSQMVDNYNIDTNSSNKNNHNLVIWLSNFYDQTIQFVQDELRLCDLIFVQPHSHHQYHHPHHHSTPTTQPTSGTNVTTSTSIAVVLPSILVPYIIIKILSRPSNQDYVPFVLRQ
jgi:hypothetical protein